MTETTPGPGARLKGERERRGLSLQKAADEMRLDAWVIEALEADQYDRVGPAVYAKGHLKKYVTILGLSWEEILSGYEALRTAPESPPQMAPSMRMRAPVADVSHWPRTRIAVLAGLLLVLGVALLWKPWQQRPVSVAATATATASAATADAPASGAATPSAAPADPDQPVYAAGDPAAAGASEPQAPAAGVAAVNPAGAGSPQPGYGPTRLRLSFSAESWVDIHDVDGKRVYSGYGRANSVKTLAGDGPLKVYLGYASGVQLEINERAVAIASAFVHGDVARFQAGADGVLRNFTTDTLHPPG